MIGLVKIALGYLACLYVFVYSRNLVFADTHQTIPIVLAWYWMAALMVFFAKTSMIAS